jgi:hypothetical protein
MAYFPMIGNGPHKKWGVRRFCNCCFCIRWRSNVFNRAVAYQRYRDAHTATHIGGIYEECSWDELRCHDVCTKFHNDWFRHLKVDRWGYTDTQTQKHTSLVSSRARIQLYKISARPTFSYGSESWIMMRKFWVSINALHKTDCEINTDRL